MPVSQQNTLSSTDLGVSVADSHGTYFPNLTRVMDMGESIKPQGDVDQSGWPLLVRAIESGSSLPAQTGVKDTDYSYNLSGVLSASDPAAMRQQDDFDEAADTFDFSGLSDWPATDHKDDGTLNSLELRETKDDAPSNADEPGLPGVTVYLDANHNDSLDAAPAYADDLLF